MTEEKILVNNYIPTCPKHEDDLHEILLRHEYERINKNKKDYFRKAEIINFDIIYNQCRGDPLKKSLKYYQTINKHNIQKAKEEDQDEFISEAIKSNRKDVYIEHDIINRHFKLSQEAMDFKAKNMHLFSSMHGRKKNKNKLI